MYTERHYTDYNDSHVECPRVRFLGYLFCIFCSDDFRILPRPYHYLYYSSMSIPVMILVKSLKIHLLLFWK